MRTGSFGPEKSFTFLLGPNFNYLQTYEINCTKDLRHEIVKFNVKKSRQEGGIISALIPMSTAIIGATGVIGGGAASAAILKS